MKEWNLPIAVLSLKGLPITLSWWNINKRLFEAENTVYSTVLYSQYTIVGIVYSRVMI